MVTWGSPISIYPQIQFLEPTWGLRMNPSALRPPSLARNRSLPIRSLVKRFVTIIANFLAWWNTLFVFLDWTGFSSCRFTLRYNIQRWWTVANSEKTNCRFYRTRGAGSFKEATADFWVCSETSLQSDLSLADISGDAIWWSTFINFPQSNIGRWKLWNGWIALVSWMARFSSQRMPLPKANLASLDLDILRSYEPAKQEEQVACVTYSPLKLILHCAYLVNTVKSHSCIFPKRFPTRRDV